MRYSSSLRYLVSIFIVMIVMLSGCFWIQTPVPTLPITNTPVATTPVTISTPGKVTPTVTTTVAPGKMRIRLYFIALNDDGRSGKKIGCGDSIVAVERIIPETRAPLTAAFNELLSIREQIYGQSGLYNALYQSSLKLESAWIFNAKATINLSGTIKLGGVCDNPRVEAQINETALQFSTVKDVAVMINSIPLEKILSEKGG